jgi:pilus assembly protein CpaF
MVATSTIFIERAGKIERTDATFADNAHLLRIIDKIVSQVGRRVDEASPMVDARLPDGSRVNAVIPPLSLRGPTLTIRKFSRDPYTMDDLIAFGSLTGAAQFLAALPRGWAIITGGTGTGRRRRWRFPPSSPATSESPIEDAAELQPSIPCDHIELAAGHRGPGRDRVRELVRNSHAPQPTSSVRSAAPRRSTCSRR